MSLGINSREALHCQVFLICELTTARRIPASLSLSHWSLPAGGEFACAEFECLPKGGTLKRGRMQKARRRLVRMLENEETGLHAVPKDSRPNHASRTLGDRMTECNLLAGVERFVMMYGPESLAAEVHQTAADLDRVGVVEVEHNLAI